MRKALNKARTKPDRRLWFIGLGVLLVACLVVAWQLRPKREDEIAQLAGRCFLDSDYHCLMALASPKERQAFNLSGEQLSQLSEFAKESGVAELKQVSNGTTNYFGPGAQGDYSVEVENGGGKRFALSFQVIRQESGSYRPFTHSLLNLSLVMIHQDRNLPVDGLSELNTLRLHVLEHADDFERLGIKGHYSKKFETIESWEKIAARYGQLAERIARERAKQP